MLTVGVVGCGAGGLGSIRGAAASELFRLTAVADLRPDVLDRVAAEFSGVRTYTSAAEMTDGCPTDVVCVATYASSHEEIALAAMTPALRGILVEKPLGPTTASGRRIVDAAKSMRLPLVVPHGLVARKVPLEVIARVRQGDIGDLRLVEIESRGWDIINAGIHWLHFFVTLVDDDPLESVLAACDSASRTYRDGFQVETEAIVAARTRSGVRVLLNTGDYLPVSRPGKDTLLRIVGSAGVIEFWPWDDEYLVQNRAHPSGDIVKPAELPVTGHRLHLEALAGMILEGRTDYRLADSSLRALELCEAAYLSNRLRCRVTLPLDDFVAPPSANDWDPGRLYSGTGGGRDGRAL